MKSEEMIALIDKLKSEFDYVIIDCPAGIEQGFENAVVGADRALIVVNPEVTSIRDAYRVIGKLDEKGFTDHKVIVNRIDYEMVRNGEMLDVDDVIDSLEIELIGIIPNDKLITISTNKGEPIVLNENTNIGKKFKNIATRITGVEVPFEIFEDNNGKFTHALKKLFNLK